MTQDPNGIAPGALDPEEGWAPLGPWPFPHGKPGRFVVGDESGTRYRIAYYRDAADEDVLHGKVWFGPGAEGPPMHAHGGSMAAVLDEALGMACWAAGLKVVAAELTTRFRRMLPLGRVVEVRARIVDRGERYIKVTGELFDDTAVYAKANAIYALITEKLALSIQASLEGRDG